MKRIDFFFPTIAIQFAPSVLHSLPLAMIQKEPIAFLSVTFREWNCFMCRKEKVPFDLDQVNASLFPEPRPFCTSGTWSRKGGSEWSGISFSSSHPTHAMEKSTHPYPKGERKACVPLLPLLLAYCCGLLQPTSHLWIPPRQYQAQGSMLKSTFYPPKFTSNHPFWEISYRLFLVGTVTTTLFPFCFCFLI